MEAAPGLKELAQKHGVSVSEVCPLHTAAALLVLLAIAKGSCSYMPAFVPRITRRLVSGPGWWRPLAEASWHLCVPLRSRCLHHHLACCSDMPAFVPLARSAWSCAGYH